MNEEIQHAVADVIKQSDDKTVEIKPAHQPRGRKRLPMALLAGGAIAVGYWMTKTDNPAEKIREKMSKTANRTKQRTEETADTIEQSGDTLAGRVEAETEKAGEQVQQTGETVAEETEKTSKKAAEKTEEAGK